MKLTFHTDKLEGELVPKTAHVIMLAGGEVRGLQHLLYKHDNIDKLHKVVAYILRWSSRNNLRRTK